MPIPVHTQSISDIQLQQRALSQPSIALEHFRIKDVPPAAYYIPDFITEDEEAYLLKKIEESPQPKWKTVGTGRRLQYWGGTMSKNGYQSNIRWEDPIIWLGLILSKHSPDLVSRINSFLSKASPEGPRLDTNQVLVNEYKPGQGISPHEDGPAFQSLVATVSLGSHVVLDLHHYISSESPSPPMVATSSLDHENPHHQAARTVSAVPLAHLLLLPRSLFILSSSLYTSHLHAVDGKAEDVVKSSGTSDDKSLVIANAELLDNPEIMKRLCEGGTWSKPRGVRTSLTFRHAQKVLKGGALGKCLGALHRS